ncbi:hypothetical protein PCNPT3_09530 [Psychromonas sp. CNPT3]|uniref:DUF3549 family protein n=1 Tax=Psychromonas sp. CNPT3 TaxID=314282 RepID=UPI00006E914F|nr:DUF3549 family protein [Psychromonas sp. CNPT3]AGH81844.1 hypothetical protein PCNPT3_09530 [Psychromonas sp. CNPT3]
MMNINTLTDFLEQAQCQYRVYDLGRKVSKISNNDFIKICTNKKAYPYPLQKNAYFALTFWQVTQKKEHFIWFLKMPVDEKGLLKIGAQTSFIDQVVEAMGHDLTLQISKQQQQKLAQNPFVFKPNAEKLAIFNALINVAFIRPASPFFAPALDYFSGNTHWDAWQTLGIQGIADICARLDDNTNQQHLIHALKHLPQQPLQSLALCLESQNNINTSLSEAIAEQAIIELKNDRQESAILLLRAISNSPAKGVFNALFDAQFQSTLIHNPHWYIGIVGRCWQHLDDDARLHQFFEALATHQASLFSALFSDLVSIPQLREKVLKQLRVSTRSEAFSLAIGHLFSNIKSSTSDV